MTFPPARPPVRPPDRLTFHVIPHTHWDREWYLTRSGFQARLIPVVDALLEQLERDPDARFVLDGQTVLLEDYLAIRPEQEDRIAAQVQRGALEIGPWYVLSDLLIPAAASLRRNLAEGARDAARFGQRLAVLYSPDAFGHPGGLPRLAAESGLRYAVIRRGLSRPLTRDRDLYRWEAEDGASVLVYHLPPGGYDLAVGLADAGHELRRRWLPIRHQLVERAATREIAVFLGADHHPMVRDLAGLRARLQALEPEHEVRCSGLAEFFAAVERARPAVPLVRGELRKSGGHAWVLQDVHSTRARLKRKHARAELLLSRIAEPLAGLAARQGAAHQDGLLRAAWRILLQCQFHDTLAGTTCDAVQQEQEVRLDAVEALCRELAARSLAELVGHDPDRARASPERVTPRLVLWNPAASPRAQLLTAELSFFRRDVLVGRPGRPRGRSGEGYQPFVLEAPSGQSIPVQLLAMRQAEERLDAPGHYPDQDEVDRVWIAFRAPEVPGLGTTLLTPRFRRGSPSPEGISLGDTSLANRFVALEVSATGSLTLTDRQSGERYPGLAELCDEPDQGDCYTFSRGPGRPQRVARPLAQRVLAHGPLVASLETRCLLASAGRGELGIRLVTTLHADSPLVRLRLELENHAVDHRLRARFPVGIRTSALAGTAFGVQGRPPVLPVHPPALEQEVATAPAHRFVAAAGPSRGLAILAPGCFEYEWTRQGDLLITLLRSVGELSRGNLPERPGHAAWPLATPLAQELGTHTIELALAPLGGEALDAGELERLWETAFLPVQAVFMRDYLGWEGERE
jgi:mannosylglycerate hydrolase